VLGFVAAACTAALLAGCTSNAEPTPLPEPSPSSASASPTPSATPPSLPPEAEGTSPQAAKAFAHFYVDSVNYAMATGETRDLEGLAAEACRACHAITDGIRDAYAGGGRLEGRGWLVRDVQYLRLASDKALIGVTLRIARQADYESGDAKPRWSRASRGHLDLRMSWRTGQWRVFELVANQ
jgi:hypothetical protein